MADGEEAADDEDEDEDEWQLVDEDSERAGADNKGNGNAMIATCDDDFVVPAGLLFMFMFMLFVLFSMWTGGAEVVLSSALMSSGW